MDIPRNLEIDIKPFKQYVSSGELHERDSGSPFINILIDLDKVLFPVEGKIIHQGWRECVVHVGWYIPPAPGAVSHLLEIFANKVQSLYAGEKYVKSEDYTKFVAWATLILMDIHPKRDGNGRLAQAVAEYLMPDKHISGFTDEMWNNAFIASDLGIIDTIAKKQGRKRPDVPQPPVDDGKLQLWWVDYGGILKNFYNYQGRDWSAEFLEEAINNTTVDAQGKFQPVGISSGSLGLMEEFMRRAPLRQFV